MSRLQEEGKLADLEPELLKFDMASLVGEEKESLYYPYGIIALDNDNRALAFERFQEGIRQCLESAVRSFAPGQSTEHRRNFTVAFA